jgi:16S rRNA (guanine(966)-N(2))-methyltransferase RsmD
MRVIAGTFRSRQLKSLKGNALRPTSDRMRETLFNVIADRVPGSRFLDIFAGTGAVGIEALSRGAKEAVFLENHAPAAALIRKNLAALDIRSGARVLPLDALRGLEKLASEPTSRNSPFELVFLDPPYAAAEEYARVLNFLEDAPFLSNDSIVIAEHRYSFDLPEAVGYLQRARVLRQGDASLTFYKIAGREPQE